LPVRVYECDRSEAEALKKVLEYDPYTDASVIPSAPRCAEKPADKLTEGEEEELEEYNKKMQEVREKLSKDPRAQTIFVRQGCNLKDGAILGLNSSKLYLYINAAEDFFPKAELRFKNEFKTIKRADKKDEDAVIAAIKKEEDNAGAGFGSIFG
jgi:hypothetical protein